VTRRSRLIQPGRRFAPTLDARPILLPAMTVVAASNSSGASCPAGAAKAKGLVPIFGSAPKVGSVMTPVAVVQMPIMPSSAASIAWCPMAPVWPELYRVTSPVPTCFAFSMAMRM